MNSENMCIVNRASSYPRLSVIIPIYNAEKLLSRCLDSILDQTFTDFEVILIDDGSTDTSSDICLKYSRSDSRFQYIRKENGGAYQSRIYGAERALGTYIMFCDADDYYLNKGAFARLYEEITKSNCQALEFGYIKKYNHLRKKSVQVKTPLDIDTHCFFSQEYPVLLCSSWEGSHLTVNVWNKVYHRSLLSMLPSSEAVEKIFWGDDMIINLHLLSDCESFRFIPDTLYCYCELSGGTNRFSLHTMRDLDNIKKHQLLMFWKKYQGDSEPLIKNKLFGEVAAWFFIYIQQALEHLDEEELVRLINEVLQYQSFILAREYYMNRPGEKWDAVDLLRKSDAREYIRKAKERCANKKAKDTVKNILRRIYSSI